MKLHIVSDLHLEFCICVPDAEAVAAADVIVLAGDIGCGLRGTRWAQEALPTNKPVIYVAGNHEFYGLDRIIAIHDMRQDCRGTNVHFLDRDELLIDGVRFLGATLWTDYALYGRENDSAVIAAMNAARRGLNDHWQILEGNAKKHHHLFTPEHALQEHRLTAAWLADRLQEQHLGPTVVVTHHAPSGRSTAPYYLGDELSPCFASNLPVTKFFGGKASLWIHGHMHNSSDYAHVGTRVVCNPMGYPRSRFLGPQGRFENSEFDAGLIVEV